MNRSDAWLRSNVLLKNTQSVFLMNDLSKAESCSYCDIYMLQWLLKRFFQSATFIIVWVVTHEWQAIKRFYPFLPLAEICHFCAHPKSQPVFLLQVTRMGKWLPGLLPLMLWVMMVLWLDGWCFSMENPRCHKTSCLLHNTLCSPLQA